jgi:F-type H+-transporting ATPase subunit b
MNNPLIAPDPGLFIWTILTFLGLLVFLKVFAWKPLLAALEARQEAIRKSLDDAQQAKQELERLRVESAEILRQARAEAESIVVRSRSDAERLREEIKQKARADAEGIARNAEGQIQLATREALRQIRFEAVDLSVTIASKLLQRNLSQADNQRLIDEALKEIEASEKK